MSSILSPEFLWINKRCYRVNFPIEQRNNQSRPSINYEEEDFSCEITAEDIFDEIQPIDNGSKFELILHVPSYFYPRIIGPKAATKKRLEQETSTQITVPKIGSKFTNITITGKSRRNVLSARNRIDLIVISGRQKLNFTHFLSIAFTSSEIQQNFDKFKKEILSDPEIFGIDESLFSNPQKLHLTIGTLSLLDNEDRMRTSEMLQDCQESIIKPIIQGNVLKAKMIGLNYMNDDPSAVDVLYGKVMSENLQQIANGIVEYFASRGFMQTKHDSVKLHVTLINSLFRDSDDAETSHNAVQGNRITFDATKILKKYKDYYFGDIIIKEIHLSQRYSTATNGYFESTAILKI